MVVEQDNQYIAAPKPNTATYQVLGKLNDQFFCATFHHVFILSDFPTLDFMTFDFLTLVYSIYSYFVWILL